MKEYKKALLDIWYKLGHGELFDRGCDGVDETIQLLSTLDIKRKSINGINLIYSESLKNIQLIWEFSKWVLERDEVRGIKVQSSLSSFNDCTFQIIYHY